MAQSDFAFSAAYLGTLTSGSAVAHNSLSNPLYTSAEEKCRYWVDDGSGSRADSPKGVFAKCEVPSLVSVSDSYGISLRAWFRVPSSTSQNSIVGLRAKGAGSTQPSGYNFFLYQNKLYTDLVHVNGSLVSVDGDLSVAAPADTWHRIRMDIVPVAREGTVLMDRVRYFTWNADDSTWTLRGERYYEVTDTDYVAWSDPTNAYSGFFMIHANSAGAASSASGYVDDFQVRLEEISTSARGISGIITPEAPAADPLTVTDEISPFFGRSTGEFSNLYAFAALKSDGSVVTWGTSSYGGNSDSTGSALTANVKQVYSTQKAFAALKQDGSVIVWGDSTSGGSASGVDLTNVKEIFSTSAAFAALKNDGSVVTWGNADRGGDSSNVAADLASGVTEIVSCFNAFSALKSDGSVVVWGNASSSQLQSADLSSGITAIRATDFSFAGLKSDGTVEIWGSGSYGGSFGLTTPPTNVVSLYSNTSAFVAVDSSGKATAWGWGQYGGDASAVAADLESGVSSIYAGARVFAALKDDGSVVAWGTSQYGGSAPAGLTGVTSIANNDFALAAIKSDGSVVVWGSVTNGGSIVGLETELASGVTSIVATQRAFAAIKSDGSVVTWGHADYGADSSSVDVSSGVSKVFGNINSFTALKTDGSLVVWGGTANSATTVQAEISSDVLYVATALTDDNLSQ